MSRNTLNWIMLLALMVVAVTLYLLPGNIVVGPGPDRSVNNRIVFTSTQAENYELYSMEPDGAGLTRLTWNDADDYNASWSPDGRHIAFTSHRDGDYEIYVMEADGGDPRRLTFTPGMDDFPAWSPDGGQIVFTSARNGSNEIYLMRADGTYQTNLTAALKKEDAYVSDHTPSWSPDGQYIVFVSTRDGDGAYADAPLRHLYLMHTDGSKFRLLTDRLSDTAWPSWSPSGEWIAFITGGQLCMVHPNGSGQTCFNTDFDVDGQVTWSPDGSQLVFGSYMDNAHGNIYTINVDGSGLRQLTDAPGQNTGPAWTR
jgi:Tol biopolymer transport system component